MLWDSGLACVCIHVHVSCTKALPFLSSLLKFTPQMVIKNDSAPPLRHLLLSIQARVRTPLARRMTLSSTPCISKSFPVYLQLLRIVSVPSVCSLPRTYFPLSLLVSPFLSPCFSFSPFYLLVSPFLSLRFSTAPFTSLILWLSFVSVSLFEALANALSFTVVIYLYLVCCFESAIQLHQR